jgi:hypothetical protein
MKNIIPYFIFIFVSMKAYSQEDELSRMRLIMDSLNRYKIELNEKIVVTDTWLKFYQRKIELLETEKNTIEYNKFLKEGIKIKLAKRCNTKVTPSSTAPYKTELKDGEEIKILGFEQGFDSTFFFKILHKKETLYVEDKIMPLNDVLISLRKSAIIYHGFKITTSNNDNTPPNNNSTNSTNNISPSNTIETGKRGGKYYINSNGNKTYIKKKQ